jgi:tetratricopeptide (TPR) repeat protein
VIAAMMVGVPGRVAKALTAVLTAAIVTMACGPALADDRTDARAHYDRATTAYALGRYGDAAAEFDQAFTLKADPAILYNAAQAYRLAGNKERALQLYRNYLRVYGHRAEHAPDVEWHIGELEKVGPAQRPAAPVERASLTAVAPAAPPPASVVTAQQLTPSPPAPAASLVSPPPPASDVDRPIYQRWWFWAGAGAVVVGAVVGVVLATRKSADCGGGVDYCANTGL